MHDKSWLEVLNRVYGTQCSSMEEIKFLMRTHRLPPQKVDFCTPSGEIWASYHTHRHALIGYNQHALSLPKSAGEIWWGEEWKESVKRGDWVCKDGSLRNRSGSEFVVCGFVPLSVLSAFLHWQPMAAQYA